MKKHLIDFFRRYPTLFTILKKLHYSIGIRRLKEHLLKTSLRENEWATRHLRQDAKERNDWGKGQRDWIKSYWDSRDHSHRNLLIQKISAFSPKSVLEIGSNCGPNLYLLAKKFPQAEIVGIDINPEAVRMGNKWLAEEDISNVKLFEGRADKLQFQDQSFDVVFTDAVLIYIGPDKIEQVIKEMIRITRKVLIFVEWHCFQPMRNDADTLGVYYKGNWKRDYVALLKRLCKEGEIHITKIGEEWPDENWKEVGAIIEVVLNASI